MGFRVERERGVKDEEWRMEDGEHGVDSECWKVDNGVWRIPGGESHVVVWFE